MSTIIVNQPAIFKITDAKLYVSVAILSAKDNWTIKSTKYNFQSTINWNRNQSKVTTQAYNQYLPYLNDPSFQWVNRLFVLWYKYIENQTSHKWYFVPTLEKKD